MNATYSPATGAVTARNMSYNATRAERLGRHRHPGAMHTGNTDRPATFTLHGATCNSG
jgi:acetylxylan esterase